MGKIEIKGPIISDGDQCIYDYFGIPAVSPSVVNRALASASEGEEITLVINSGGGSVFAGSEIYTAVRSYKGKTTAQVVGLAASAASVVAMGADKLLMSPTAQMMIHKASSHCSGNAGDFAQIADMLSGVDESIAMAYQMKTQLPTAELLEMMGKETWLTATKAKELGFADGLMFEEEITATNASTDAAGMLPQIVIDKMRLEIEKRPAETDPPSTAEQNNKNVILARARAMLVL